MIVIWIHLFFYYYIDNSTKHCAHTMLFCYSSTCGLHHQPQSEQFFDYLLHDRWVHHGRSLRSFEHPDVITRLHGPANTSCRFSRAVSNDRINRPNGAKFEILFEKNIGAVNKKQKDKKETVKIITWIIIRRFNVVWKEKEKRANALLTAKKIRPIKHKIVGPAIVCLGFLFFLFLYIRRRPHSCPFNSAKRHAY